MQIPSNPEWRHKISNLEGNLGNALAMGHIYTYLLDEVFVVDKIDPNHVGVMVVKAMIGHDD